MDSRSYVPVAMKVMLKIKAFDPSFANPDELMALAWAEVIEPWGLTQSDLLAAVTSWYRTHGGADRHPLVADIVKVARGIRNDRLARMRPDERPMRDVGEIEDVRRREIERFAAGFGNA